MRYLYPLLICCLFWSCDKQAHHEEASDRVSSEIRQGLQEVYLSLGEDPTEIESKKGRNLVYRLALHAEDEAAKLEEILQQLPEVQIRVRAYAQTSIAMVKRQRKGYPIPALFDALLKQEDLSTSEQVLLLAATARLLSESEVKSARPGLQE